MTAPLDAPSPANGPAPEPSPGRLAAFYRALSDMGQAIVHVSDPQALYDTLCGIAVHSCGASMAWLGLVEDGKVVPVAWGGDARAYAQELGIRQPREGQPDSELGPTALALRRGRPFTCNDFFADPHTLPFRALAARFGVKSSGAFPIRRAGRVIGTLNLYFDTVGAFDAALVELVEQLVLDLCFALEHIDREAARAQAERSAREQEVQLGMIVETAMDAIVAVDAQYKVVLFNQAAARMFGMSAQEAIGRPLDRFIPPEHREAHRMHLARYAAHGWSTRRMGGAAELTGVRANGERFPMEASIARAGEGERMLMTVMARDVTQLRQAEKAQLARTAAEAANRAKTEFLSRISHELRTPLNAVLGFAQLLRTETDDPLSPRQREQLDLVLQAGAHLRTLIDEMLDVSRIESGRMRIDYQDFPLCELLDGVMRMSQPHAQQCRVSLQAGYCPQCHVLMHSDPARLRQVMLNLLSNAIKYNRPGGWVRVEVERDQHFVHIVVRDNGLGMSPQQKAQLFQPFNRLGREHSGVQGTGIGLVLVRQLIGLMGGEIRVDSEAGQGTTVRVTLPATDDRPMAAAPGADADSQAAQEMQPRGLVLYVEDNPINAILVEQLLTRWPGIQLVVAGDGASGLDRARALRPDVVLLDMQLPDMDGVSVLKALKADERTRDIVVVALSASAVPEDVAAARAAGAADYWTKPIDFDAFVRGMRQLLAG
ncbi:MAG: ATP-binding protein [Pseudomonadota bacterium]